jgi:hypothetical protein
MGLSLKYNPFGDEEEPPRARRTDPRHDPDQVD